jgi:type III pantothenate kinase
MTATPKSLIAVDIGNSRIKLGQFDLPPLPEPLPTPNLALDVAIDNRDGDFEISRIKSWAETNVSGDSKWLISSVHSQALILLLGSLKPFAGTLGREWSLHVVSNDEVPLTIDVEEPDLVGTDRLTAALAADRLRRRDRAAVVVGSGTAITVDLVSAAGVFKGGAILPGMAMSAWALEQQTDALPHVAVDQWTEPPAPLGRDTEQAIESGLFWGSVGGVRELIQQYTRELSTAPDVFVSGGASSLVARVLAESSDYQVLHVPNLVLSGIALMHAATATKTTS